MDTCLPRILRRNAILSHDLSVLSIWLSLILDALNILCFCLKITPYLSAFLSPLPCILS
uniref:Uncharacterized protein n=1 Tax=Mus musculus TaxID=10090 RepID=Q3TD79_MOUSE|nr:unnamed protein product [Mus musculus]